MKLLHLSFLAAAMFACKSGLQSDSQVESNYEPPAGSHDRPDDEESTYFYRIKFTQVVLKNGSTDTPTIHAIQVVNKNHSGACVDIRNSGFTGDMAVGDGSVSLLSKHNLPPSTIEDIKTAICSESTAGCSVSIELSSYPNTRLAIQVNASNGSNPGIYKLENTSARLPQFSAACETGKYSDSWNNAASTSAAKSLLSGLGIDIQQVKTLDLYDIRNNRKIYTFGFVRQN